MADLESGEDEEEDLHGCYLLYSLNERCRGRTYIGYTVNPMRRIRQHNNGIQAGGAKKTNNRGPWEMVFIVHGFPNSILALKFEWAWQHPHRSRRLKQVVRYPRRQETALQYKIYLVSEMLRVGPWKRLPLVVRWIKPEYFVEFEPGLQPPRHMPIVYGLVKAKKQHSPKKNKSAEEEAAAIISSHPISNSGGIALQESCSICKSPITDPIDRLQCLNPSCSIVSHMICLAEQSTQGIALLPIESQCQACKQTMLWGDLIKHKNGCHRKQAAVDPVENHDHWTNELHLKNLN